jgi:hypothetical protein
MQFKSIPWWLWLIPIAILLIATQKLPYGYYTITRIVVCGFAGFLAWMGWEESSASRGWSTVLGIVAVLFNPIFPIFLSRGTWLYLDLCIALIFAAHLGFVRLYGCKQKLRKLIEFAYGRVWNRSLRSMKVEQSLDYPIQVSTSR